MNISPEPLAQLPPEMKPDRREVITAAQDAPAFELEAGITLYTLVGAVNQARNLTTGVVTFESGARLAYHKHTFAESVTVLEGSVTAEAEGRCYAFGALDNIVFAAGLAHSVVNTGPQRAVLHVALAADTPSRELVDDTFERRVMSADETGPENAERVNRSAGTPCYEPNPGARFQDYFNRDLGCEEMSGGYGLFEPGAQLPCHIHDFDESISIVSGTATCVVEGKRYTLSDNATALVPRGRCHYFINESDAPMAMVWVYAGPLPLRQVMVSELCDCGHD